MDTVDEIPDSPEQIVSNLPLIKPIEKDIIHRICSGQVRNNSIVTFQNTSC